MKYFENSKKKLLFFCNPLTVTLFLVYIAIKYIYYFIFDAEKIKQIEDQLPIIAICLLFALACSLIFPMDSIMNVSTQLFVKIMESWATQLNS